MSADIFNTAAWNFLSGNRDVESIIRDNPDAGLVIRGGISRVLPTVNCLRDLSKTGWRDFPTVRVRVPSNAVTSHNGLLSGEKISENFTSDLLEKSYGIRTVKRPVIYEKALYFLTDYPTAGTPLAETLKELLKEKPDVKLMAVFPEKPGSPDDTVYLPEGISFSTIYEGSNIFFPAMVEEVLWDYEPEKIVIIGNNPERILYSSIGAADWFILAESRYKNPSEMKIWDLVSLGRNVTAVMPSGNGLSKKGGIYEALAEHLKKSLDVESTDPDYRFTTLPDYNIAIDLIYSP